jgi:hypothetical protein
MITAASRGEGLALAREKGTSTPAGLVREIRALLPAF